MEIQKIVTKDTEITEKLPCFRNFNKLIKSPEIIRSISSVFTYRMYLKFYQRPLEELRKNPRVEFEISEIIKGELKGDMYRQIDNALAELKTISLKMVDTTKPCGDITYVSLFRETGYTKKHSRKTLWVLVEEKAFPILEKLYLEGYTDMPSKELVNVPTIHGTRTYEILAMLSRSTETAYFTIENFKKYIGISTAMYPKWPNLKQRVIDPDKKVINANTGLSYDYKTKKINKKVVGLYLVKIKNNSEQEGLTNPHLKIIDEHIWPTHQHNILNNYPPEHIMYYHEKCHKIADSGKILDLNSFIYKSIIEDKDNYKTIIENKKAKKLSEQKIREAKEREIAESEKYYKFSKGCYDLLSNSQKETYEAGINGFTDKSIILSIAVSKFMENNEHLLRKCKSPEEFISAYNIVNNDV